MSSFSPIPLTPSMDKNTMISAINDAFRQIQAENRRQVITDENGNDIIVIGRQEDGSYNISMRDSDGREVLRIGPQPGGGYGFSMYDDANDERIRLGRQPDNTIKMVQTKPGSSILEAYGQG